MRKVKPGLLFSLTCKSLLYGLLLLFTAEEAVAKGGIIHTVDSLNAEALRYYNTDFNHAQKLASAAQQLALSADYEQGVAKAVSVAAMVDANKNKCKEAIDALTRTIKSSPDILSRAILHAALGVSWYCLSSYDSASSNYERALQLYTTSGYDPQCVLHVLLQAGKVYIKTGKQAKALQHYQQAMAILQKQPNEECRAWADDLAGEIYYAQRLYEKSLAYSDAACRAFVRMGNRRGAGSSLIHKGNACYMLMKDDSAQGYYELALKEFATLGDDNGMAIAYANLSRVELEGGKHREAIAYAEQALATIAPGNYVTIEANTYQQLGDIYGETGNYGKAIAYVQKALQAAQTIDNKTITRDCHKSLSELYQAMGKPAQAMQHLLAAYRLKDSIQPVSFTSQLADMEAKYEAEKKQAQIKLLQQQGQISKLKLQQQEQIVRKQRYLLLMSCVVIAAIVLAVYYYVSQRRLREQMNRREAIRETEERERIRIAKDIHDELGSGLSKIRFLSEMAVTQTGNEAHYSLHSISDTSRGLVENMRDLVWAMNPENTTLDNLVARIREYSHDYLEEFPIEVVFDFPDDVPGSRITQEVSRNVHMIVKETLQNIVKHSGATKVFIKLSLQPALRLEIKDNGRGYDATLQTEGNGLKNITARSHALGATLQMSSLPGIGTTLVIELPVAGV